MYLVSIQIAILSEYSGRAVLREYTGIALLSEDTNTEKTRINQQKYMKTTVKHETTNKIHEKYRKTWNNRQEYMKKQGTTNKNT